MTHKAVLLDTSFFLRFLNDQDPLFNIADKYFRYFLREKIEMRISTISIAEYCVLGSFSELPLKNMIIVPFNLDHSIKAGELAKIVFQNKGQLKLRERNIIPNDTKLFAQACFEKLIILYLTSDKESRKIYDLLKQKTGKIDFEFIDLNEPFYY